ncbi:peptidase S58, DmpA [Saccharothrix yanglingensis]|uniref:peptidase S58, DmpA n=1 Tax=Saccharothrix yanglingensis TaxID=659496 RepID=UPI0027D29332|nr:peptidase S58, DmpA [Saccharothrix yanglingensis]
MLVGRAPGVVVLLAPGGAVAGVDVRGAPVGTRELDLLDPTTLVRHVHAVVLCGGGLAAAEEVVGWLAAREVGFPVGAAPSEVVPIVPAAAALGLAAGDGRAACEAAREEPPAAVALVGDTAVGLVVVEADLTQAECRRVAVSARDGFARAGVLVPATVFAVASGIVSEAPLDVLCARAAEALEGAVAVG